MIRKNNIRILILITSLVHLILACSSPCAPIKSTTEIRSSQVEAIHMLKDFLFNRSEGRFDECAKVLTDNFIKSFKKTYGTDYVDFFRNQNEDYFKDPVIIESLRINDSAFIFKSTVEVQGPGYKNKASEVYSVILEKGLWKVDEWQIKYE